MVGRARFNEAAGIPRGRRRRSARSSPASLGFNEAAGIPRGRHDSAKNILGTVTHASMRPRVFPAEDDFDAVQSGDTARVASMRPRVFPAEDFAWNAKRRRGEYASMRPRVFPAEDSARTETWLRRRCASMRPRVFPAEDPRVDDEAAWEAALQ